MGVDYRGEYGIGYEVTESDEIMDTEPLEDGLIDYLENELNYDVFDYFQIGYELNSYIRIRDPFKDGLDLSSAKLKLDEELSRLKLDPIGKFGVHGGLYVY